jgi:hypothetical protein
MPYNVAANMQFAKPVSAALDARDSVLRNTLAERQVANAEQTSAFNQQRLTATDQIVAQQRQKEAEAADAQKLHTAMQYLSNVASNPEQFASTAQRMLAHPDIGRILQSNGVTLPDITPQNVQELLAATGVQAGQGPAPTPVPFEQTNDAAKLRLQHQQELELERLKQRDSAANRGGYRPLTAAEVAAAGLPPGTSAQVGPDNKIDILSKRDNTGVLSQKDQTTAKMKLNTVALARSQLQKIKDAFEEGRKGMNAFGPGQGLLPTQSGKKFDARVDQMRSTLTALTRVPGVGAMSDYETKLDQSKFPSRNAYESVTADVIRNLDDQLSLIENGYKGLLSGGSEQPTSQPPPAQVVDWASLK